MTTEILERHTTTLAPAEINRRPAGQGAGYILASRLRWPAGMGMVLLLTAILFMGKLGACSFWSEETRWGEIPREMQRDGNFFWPTFNGQTYYDKPLGSYWLVLLAARVTGQIDEEAARLPSALSGLLAVAVMMLLTRRIYDERTALLAGLILGTSFSFVFFSRNAASDMENLAGILTALWLFHRNYEKPTFSGTMLFWLTMSLTSLTKGLLGFALPLLVSGIYATLYGPGLPHAGRLTGLRGAQSLVLQPRHAIGDTASNLALPGALSLLDPSARIDGWDGNGLEGEHPTFLRPSQPSRSDLSLPPRDLCVDVALVVAASRLTLSIFDCARKR